MVQRCSNEVGFIVLDPEPAVRTGISVEIYDGANPLNLLDILPDTWGRRWTEPRKGTGAAEFKVSALNPKVLANPDLLKAGNVVRLLLDRIPRFAFKIEERELTQIEEGGDSAKAWHIKGRGALSLLEDAQVYLTAGLTGEVEREFTNQNAGQVMGLLVDEAQARPSSILDVITEGYTATRDSDNQPWAELLTMTERAGTDLLRVAERIAEMAADVYMTPTLELRIVNTRGVDRSVQTPNAGPIILQPGDNILELSRSESAVIRNALLIETPGGFVERLEAGSVSEYRRREAYLSLGNITDTSQIDKAADAVFERSANPAEGITIRVTDDDGKRPYVDWGVGDWVLAPDIEGNLERFRVNALTIAEDEEGNIDAIPELATLTDDLEERLARWLQAMARGTMGGTAADVTEPVKATAEVTAAVDDGITGHVATHAHPDEFSDLADVDVTGLNAGDLLQFDGTDWVPLDGSAEGDMLYRTAAGLWVPVGGTKADGKTPTIQASGAVEWETPAGGGGGSLDQGAESLLNVRTEVNPEDDHFNAGSLAGKWVTGFSGGHSADLATMPGWLILNGGLGILQPIPAGDWFIETFCMVPSMTVAGYNSAGLVIANGTAWASSQAIVLIYGSNNSLTQFRMTYERFTNGAYQGTYFQDTGTEMEYSSGFLRLQKSGSNYIAHRSKQGHQWTQRHSTTIPFTPTHFGLFGGNGSRFDYFVRR